MDEDLVMRSVFLPTAMNAELRQLAREIGCTFSELVRAAVASKVQEWYTDSVALERDLAETVRRRVAAGGLDSASEDRQ
jgi:hypothetical protein